MSDRTDQSSLASLPLIALLLLLAGGGGFLITRMGPGIGLGAAVLALIVFASFLNAELGLHIILLSMLLSPEIVIGGAAGVSVGKPAYKGDLLVVRLEDIILAAVTLAWLARTAIFKELGLVRQTRLNGPIFLYIASLILSTLFGAFFGAVQPVRGAFFLVKYIEYFVVYFVAINHIRERRQFLRVLATAFATCFFACIIGITQIPSGQRVSAPFEGNFGEPNTFGGYLVFMLALILGMALTVNGLPARIGWFAFAAFVLIPLLFTLSRSSWLAAGPMLLTLILLSRRRALLIIPLAAAIALGPILLPEAVIKRYRYTLEEKFDRGDYQLGGAKFDTSTSARFDSFVQGFQGWMKQPFLGYGVTGFAFMDAQYVRILVEAGLIGLAAFIWLIWRILAVAWDTWYRIHKTSHEGLAVGYIAGVVGMLVHAVGANTFIIVRIMEPFWFLTGIIVVLPSLIGQQESPPSRTTLDARTVTSFQGPATVRGQSSMAK